MGFSEFPLVLAGFSGFLVVFNWFQWVFSGFLVGFNGF